MYERRTQTMYRPRTLIVLTAMVAATLSAGVAQTAGADPNSGGRPHAQAQKEPSSEPMPSCRPFVPNDVMKPGVFTTIADEFTAPRGEWWCNATMPSGAVSFGSHGVTLSIPDYTALGSTAWTARR